MNTTTAKKLMLAFIAACSCAAICYPSGAIAQLKERPLEVTNQVANQMDETTLRKKMKEDGLSSPVIDKLIAQRKLWIKQGRNVAWTNVKDAGTNPIANAACSDMGGDNGWGQWKWQKGSNSGANPPTWAGSPALNPAAPDFVLTSGAGIDANTPSPPPATNPSISVVCPGFGTNSIKIGDDCNVGSVCQQLTYALTVTPQDTSFLYSYAIVIEDAGHLPSEQPFVSLCIYDTNGNPIPCGCFTYTGGASIPGFFYVSGTSCAFGGVDQYKPWTLVGVNLSPYVGQTLNVVITNADCIYGGHFAYSYWDFMCNSIAGTSANYCQGNPASICAPYDPAISYTYQWYQNGTPIPPPQGTQQCITPIVTPGDTFSVAVMQPSGCNFQESFAPQEINIQPGFIDSIVCKTGYFIDTSASNGTINGWSWNFGDGSPLSISQNPIHTYANSGTYTVTLIVSCTGGCKDTASAILNILPPMIMQSNDTALCQGQIGQLCASGALTYSWIPTGQTTSCISVQNTPYTTYTVVGANASGCTAIATSSVSTSKPTILAGPPSSVCAQNNGVGCPTLLASGGTSYVWSPSTGLSSVTGSSVTACPTTNTTYIVTGTDVYGCTNTASVTVTTLQPPAVTAGGAASICIGDSTQLSANSNPLPAGYSWTPSSGLSCINCSNPWATPPFSNTYTVTVTDVNGCTNSAAVPVTVGTLPFISAIASPSICVGDSALLNANVSNVPTSQMPVSWYWTPPNTLNNPTLQNPTTGAITTTTFVVTVTDAYGCQDDTSTVVYVQTVPSITWTQWTPYLTCDGYVMPLKTNSSSNGQSVYWNFGDGTTTNTVPPNNPDPHAYPFGGSYNVQVIVYNTPCSDTLDTTLIVNDMKQYMDIQPANVFTPNGDLFNECFHPAIKIQNVPNITDPKSLEATLSQCMEMEIFDRWGIKMFETTDAVKCWDGKTKNGTPAKEGTYYYIAKFKDATIRGFVELLR